MLIKINHITIIISDVKTRSNQKQGTQLQAVSPVLMLRPKEI